MSLHYNAVILLSMMVFTGLVLADWQVFNADTEDDDNFLSEAASSSLKKKGNRKSNDILTLAQKTYQTSAAPDPLAQFQNIAFSADQLQENSDVIAMTSSHNKKTNHNFKSTSHNKVNTSPIKSSIDSNDNKINVNIKSDISKNIQKKNEKLKPSSDETNQFLTVDFASRELLENPDYDRNAILDKVEEINAHPDEGLEEEKEFRGLFVEEERIMRERKKEEEWGEEIDCEDSINMNEHDCLYLQNERHAMADEANMSQAGDRARKQLMDFMELDHRQRREVGDEGSGAGTTYPEDEVVHNGQYNLKRTITFNNVKGDNSSEEITELLQNKLKKVFGPINGFVNVAVTNVVNNNGVVTADWALTVRGSGIGAYGGNEVDIANSLQFQLLNLSKPLFNEITIGGANPEEPLNTRDIADTLAGNLNDICSSDNPCGSDFDSCTVTGYDEGKCLHKCAILEQNKECQHGGSCEIETNDDGTTEAVCQCTRNWEGSHCESRRTLDPGEITGVTVGAALAVVGLVGACCWLAVCRRRRKPVKMTYYGDDSDSSERFSNPASKISTFVIDRPRIRANPIRSFSPHSHDDFSRPSSLSSLPPLMRPREPANLFSDA